MGWRLTSAMAPPAIRAFCFVSASNCRFMDLNAGKRIDLAVPRLLFDHLLDILIAGLPTLPDAGDAKVDVLGMILVVEAGGEQTHEMPCCTAAK